MPIYQKFIKAAKKLEPRYLLMVTPSRWFAGGRGLEVFRNDMLADKRLHALTDYPDSREVFAGVDLPGGLSYFLWASFCNVKCQITTIWGGLACPRSYKRRLGDYWFHDLIAGRN